MGIMADPYYTDGANLEYFAIALTDSVTYKL